MVSRSIPHEYFILSGIRADGPVVAQVSGRAVATSVFDAHGRRYRFVGVAKRDPAGRIDVLSLKPGEWIVSPNLIYEAA
ncbi:hypothetical protein E0H35_01860 [Rhizobium leguminosarum bv. viciae]|mgnify:CR=1 FL=1|nr:hypothetical protein [Rhizobium leguminosarum]NKK49958.1 hypothetical protein [Rhizobium leguminosarum bv. viciae]NEJ75872.1 hypothetical protein [Rhizobium leguminosarum]TBF70554.1 hypothetical protein ELG86_26555 [Rhizobium leguminosarum]TBG98090.1 hypothetical protein ELG70_26080 [Rhizobium leguminosarum]